VCVCVCAAADTEPRNTRPNKRLFQMKDNL
jgi:hypothetical protein